MIDYEEYIRIAREHQLDYNGRKGFDIKKIAYIEARTLVFEIHMLIEEILKIMILDSFMSGLLLKGDDFVEEMLDRISFYDKLQLAKKAKKKLDNKIIDEISQINNLRNNFSHGFVRYEEPVKIRYKNADFIGNIAALNDFIKTSENIVNVFQEKFKDIIKFYEKIK